MSANKKPIVEKPISPTEANGASPAQNGQPLHVPTEAVEDPWSKFMSGAKSPPRPDPSLVPSEEEFKRLNNRRHDLIDKKYLGGGLTPEEEAELQQVEIPVCAYVDFHHPLPPINIEYLKELARNAGVTLDIPENL